MKTKSLLLAGALIAVGISFNLSTTLAQSQDTNVVSQTPVAPQPVSPVPSLPMPVSLDFLTNLPTVTDFSKATIGVGTGAMLKNGNVENFIKVDGYLKTNWLVSLEIQNAPVSTVVDSISAYGGWRKVWNNAELYAELGGRRTWITSAGEPPSWQGVGLIGASWLPMTGGHVNIFGEAALTTSPRGNVFGTAPGVELRTGVKLLF